MGESKVLFYEDSKKYIARALLFAIVSYTLLVSSLTLILLLNLPEWLETSLGANFFINLLLAPRFTYWLFSKKLKYFIRISEDEMSFFVDGAKRTYAYHYLKNYKIIKEHRRYILVEITIADGYIFIIPTFRRAELKETLDHIININREYDDSGREPRKTIKQLFYEDRRKQRKGILIAACVMLPFTIGWVSLIIRSIIDLGFSGIGEAAVVISAIFALNTWLFIYRFTSKGLKQTLTITEEEFIFEIPINGQKVFGAADLTKDLEVVKLGKNRTKIKLTFKNNIEVKYTTRKYADLKHTIDFLRERNPYLD